MPIVMFMRALPEHSQLSQGAMQDPDLRREYTDYRMQQAVDQPLRESVERLCQFSSVIKLWPHHHPT